MAYNLSKKVNEKWFTFGKIAENKFGKLQASFRITPEFEALIEEAKATGWLNLSCFEEKEQTVHQESKANGYQPQPIDDSLDVPF